MTRPRRPTLNQQAKEILRLAQEGGIEDAYFFRTTFERYRVQLGILGDLEKALQNDDVLVTKEYVKGRANLYANPAIAEYNRTADSANRTVATLLKIISGLRNGKDEPEDALLDYISRR